MADTGFTRPTLQQLIDRAEADMNTNLPAADARLRRAVLHVLARITSGQAHGLYGYQKHISRQAIVDTATTESLEAWGRVWGVTRKAATKATGTITFTSSSDGTVVPAGTEFQRSDGQGYTSTASATVAGGSITVTVKADTAGTDGNAASGVQASFVSPVAGIQGSGTVDAAGLTGGAAAEADSAYRARVIERIQNPPHGGSGADYVRWALEVAGVTRAWVYPEELGRGTVTVRFVMDDSYADGIPEAGDVTTVQDHIDGLRPVTAEVTVVAPIADPVDIEITGLSPDTAEVRAAVEAELADMFRRNAKPGGTIHLSKIWEAVSVASGEDNHEITAPVASHVSATGYIPTLGNVTYA